MDEPEIKDHLDPDVKTQCAYCGRTFDIDEVVIEKEINGRAWKFCNDRCYQEFQDALDYRDEEFGDEEEGPRLPGEEE